MAGAEPTHALSQVSLNPFEAHAELPIRPAAAVRAFDVFVATYEKNASLVTPSIKLRRAGRPALRWAANTAAGTLGLDFVSHHSPRLVLFASCNGAVR